MSKVLDEKAHELEWTEILEPSRGVFKVDILEVWHYRDLLVNFIKRDFVATYKQTLLGPLWFFIQPLFTTFIFTLIFGKFASISTDGLPYILFYLSGLVIWNFFSDSLNKISGTFNTNAEIFSKVYFPRVIVPLSILFSSFIKFLVQFALFLLILGFYVVKGDIHPPLNTLLFLVPILLLITGGFALGLGMVFTSLTTKYRDLNHLLSFGIQLLMYATPIIYPLNSLSEKYRAIAALNPLSPIIEGFRYAFLGTGYFSVQGLVYSLLTMIVILVIGFLAFNRVERNFIDTI